MGAFAINAGEWGELTAAGDWSFMAALWTGLTLAEASVCGMGVILCAQWACGMLLLADGVVMSKAKAVFAVCCSRSSVEYRDMMSCREESNRIP